MIPQLAAIVTAGFTLASPPVTYDPEAKTGFVGESNIRVAFGWSPATLAARAAGIEFSHEFWTDDTYTVSCGKAEFPVVHHREFGRFGLLDTVARTRSGYRSRVIGFKLLGAHFGISGTSVAPGPGQPCPADAQGTTIKRAKLVSTATGWSLSATSGDKTEVLIPGRGRGGAHAGVAQAGGTHAGGGKA
ncbi:hypothetical protein [Paractinoplanes durhamensis]|uniref:Uncharacterized protein n=1 Tax=Paractinoplanes durhamensis TaxID=113563 RepID=A0ABQ3YU12_9ACTN|nr:hypothetical protein [Actinoplanes durhamensis]GIE01062.1 hypothetical protein Adu01nite_24120 [Actinoplanes durhamensis]